MSNSSKSAGKKVLVLGATGRCGKAVVQRALELKMQVRVYVRNEEKAKEMFPDGNVEIVKGELTDAKAIRTAVQGVDGVVSTVASYHHPHNQMSSAIKSLAEAAKLTGQPLRLFHYGLCGFENPTLDFGLRQSLGSIFSPWKFGPAIRDHRNTLHLLQAHQSRLQSTVFMTPLIDYSKPLGAYKAGSPQDVPGAKIWQKVGAADAADACLQRLDQKGPEFLYVKCE